MKAFIRFIINIIVIAVISGTIYILIMTVIPNMDINNPEWIEGEVSDNKENEQVSIEKLKKDIKEYALECDKTLSVDFIYDTDDGTILGEFAKEYIESFEQEDMGVYVTKYNGRIELVPLPDFLNNQIFYYKDGKLVLYKSISNTVEGETKYYFYNNQLIDIEIDYEEGILPTLEKEEDVILRSEKVYEKYMK